METRTLVRRAWREFKVTRQVSTGNGEKYLAQWRIPKRFVLEELGYGGHGPSIEETQRTLERTNAERRKVFDAAERERERQEQRARERQTKNCRGKAMRAALKGRAA
jgi:hypothetical protein